jgi:signal transduction histidine kinase
MLARVQATGQEIRVHPVELSPLVHEVAGSITPPDGVRIDVACPADLGVLAERDLLERAIANLAENAASHTSEGLIVIAGRAGENGLAQIEVRDTGSGMAPGDQERAFERFYRAGARGGEGFGLGLAIVREAMRALNGTVAIESEPGVGTMVRLTLPAVAVP